MADARPDLSGFRVLLPRRSLFRQALLATFAFLGPVLIVLYWLTIPDGPWVVVLVTHIIASLLFAIASWAFFATAVWVHPTGIAERGFFGGRTYFARERIESIMLVRTFAGGDPNETMPQLFVCGPGGEQLVRLRGAFWTDESMDAVSEELDIPITEFSESVTAAELLEEYPGLLYWFERRPIMAALIFGGVLVLGGLVLYGVLVSLGATN